MKIEKRMRKILVSLMCGFVFLVTGLNGVSRYPIQLVETLKMSPGGKLLGPPSSFCVTKDGLFLIPDINTGKIKVLEKEGNFLKCVSEFGKGAESFTQPRYCFCNQDGSKVGIIDYGVRKGFIFDGTAEKVGGKYEFKLLNTFECNNFGYDIKFAGDGSQCIVSGYLRDSEGKPFDLYGINNKTGQIDYLLFSPEKYGLSTYEAYEEEYFRKQTLPAIGIKGFFDIQGDDLFFMWEGALRIIKLNLRTKKITKVFGCETSHYIRPDGFLLSMPYKKGDIKTNTRLKDSFAYVRNIFATPNYIFVFYETGEKNENNSFRMQIYTVEGDFLKDRLIPGNPGRQMAIDKANNELYAFSNGASTGKGECVILKYKISIAR